MESLAGHTVGITADRRWEEQADLFRKRGAAIMHGPTMVTVELTTEPTLRAVTEAIIAAPPRWLVVTTGAGLRLWLETAGGWQLSDPLVEALRSADTAVICRGAKGASAARGAGLAVAWRAPNESMEEVVAYLRDVAGAHDEIALQLFDPDDHWATVDLRAITSRLTEVPVYRWRLPADVAPAEALVRAVARREVSAVTFTSQPAVRFLFSLADRLGIAAEVREAFATDVLAVCVGSVCAEALRECGVDRTVWPEPPRLVPMVKLVESTLAATDAG